MPTRKIGRPRVPLSSLPLLEYISLNGQALERKIPASRMGDLVANKEPSPGAGIGRWVDHRATSVGRTPLRESEQDIAV
ncbi:hypothetical protein CBM2609_U20005 [Cupriavidus taiwanensis]|nr:hypothetical protein CBM2604_U20006 [Cupriavidus taiwanensis]SOZ34505.1 hypothetical protein CBM2609_U20005 [Cupriavidus taiwanensis]